MNTPQFDAPPVKRRIPKTAIVLLVLFVFLGIVAFGWHLLTTTFAGAIGDGTEVTGSQTVAALPDALTGRLDHLEKMVRDLTDKISASIDTQTAIQNDVAALVSGLTRKPPSELLQPRSLLPSVPHCNAAASSSRHHRQLQHLPPLSCRSICGGANLLSHCVARTVVCSSPIPVTGFPAVA